jgi:hypothetical protein
VVKATLLICFTAIATGALYCALKKLAPFIQASAQAQAQFLSTLYADVAILFSAALSPFLELAIIRWQSSRSIPSPSFSISFPNAGEPSLRLA